MTDFQFVGRGSNPRFRSWAVGDSGSTTDLHSVGRGSIPLRSTGVFRNGKVGSVTSVTVAYVLWEHVELVQFQRSGQF